MESITPEYKHSRYGRLMFGICARWATFLSKHRWLYYLLACT